MACILRYTIVSTEGLPVFPTLCAIGAPVDLAIIAVPAVAVKSTIRDCAQADVHSVW